MEDDAYNTQDITCPYCGETEQYYHELVNGHFYDGYRFKFVCCNCDNKFVVTLNLSITFTSEKLSCDTCENKNIDAGKYPERYGEEIKNHPCCGCENASHWEGIL